MIVETLLYGLVAIIAAEILNYLYFHLHLRQRMLQYFPAPKFRDHGEKRHLYLKRITFRTIEHCKKTKKDIPTHCHAFLRDWFRGPFDGPPLKKIDDETYEVLDIGRKELEIFFSCSLFVKERQDLLEWEEKELQETFKVMRDHAGLVFRRESNPDLVSRRVLMDGWHGVQQRPLLVTFLVWFLSGIQHVGLRLSGFQRVHVKGLWGWYRPGNDDTTPMVFFHGIAPAGLFFYLPLILRGLLQDDDRPVMLLENHHISGTRLWELNALTEEDTVDAMRQLADKYLPGRKLLMCGHSFGSVPVTWLIKSFRERIQHVLLLDPVTFLLSEADLTVNFLYGDTDSTIRRVFGSESFTVHYLRRHLAWYNSELWLDECPDLPVTVALSGGDAIVNATRVYDHVREFDNVHTIYWEKVGHAACIASKEKWRELRNALLEQEHKAKKGSEND